MEKTNFIDESREFEDRLEAIEYYKFNYDAIRKLNMNFKASFMKVDGLYKVTIQATKKDPVEKFYSKQDLNK